MRTRIYSDFTHSYSNYCSFRSNSKQLQHLFQSKNRCWWSRFNNSLAPSLGQGGTCAGPTRCRWTGCWRGGRRARRSARWAEEDWEDVCSCSPSCYSSPQRLPCCPSPRRSSPMYHSLRDRAQCPLPGALRPICRRFWCKSWCPLPGSSCAAILLLRLPWYSPPLPPPLSRCCPWLALHSHEDGVVLLESFHLLQACGAIFLAVTTGPRRTEHLSQLLFRRFIQEGSAALHGDCASRREATREKIIQPSHGLLRISCRLVV